jgi:hypothetical protein
MMIWILARIWYCGISLCMVVVSAVRYGNLSHAKTGHSMTPGGIPIAVFVAWVKCRRCAAWDRTNVELRGVSRLFSVNRQIRGLDDTTLGCRNFAVIFRLPLVVEIVKLAIELPERIVTVAGTLAR